MASAIDRWTCSEIGAPLTEEPVEAPAPVKVPRTEPAPQPEPIPA